MAGRSVLAGRGLVISLACLALVVSLASRTIHLSAINDPTAQSDAPKAKIQHLNKDAVQWTAPVASFLFFWLAVTSIQAASDEKPPVPLHLGSCLYNRPPPLS